MKIIVYHCNQCDIIGDDTRSCTCMVGRLSEEDRRPEYCPFNFNPEWRIVQTLFAGNSEVLGEIIAENNNEENPK